MRIALKTTDGDMYTGDLVEIITNYIKVENVKCETKAVGWIPHLDKTTSDTQLKATIFFNKNNVILYYTL